jgi:hypothetical protein
MKQQGSNTRRSRSRGGGKRNSGGGGGRNSFESNGPDVKIRGSAQQVQEKYLTLAHDASSSGDWVSAEAYYQYAEHYHRISNADGGKAPAQGPAQGQSPGQKQDQGRGNVKTQEPRVAQEAPPDSDKKAEKGEAEVIDTSPAALAAAVRERESQDANAPQAVEAPVETVVEVVPETAPEKAAS